MCQRTGETELRRSAVAEVDQFLDDHPGFDEQVGQFLDAGYEADMVQSAGLAFMFYTLALRHVAEGRVEVPDTRQVVPSSWVSAPVAWQTVLGREFYGMATRFATDRVIS